MLLRSDRRDRRLRRPGIRATLASPVKKIKTPPKSAVSSSRKSAFQQSNNIVSTTTVASTVTTKQTKCNHKSLIDVNLKRLNAGNIRQQLSTSLEENACSSSITTTTEVKSTKKKVTRIVFEKQRISNRIRKLTEKENIIITQSVTKDGQEEPLEEDGEFFSLFS